MRPERARRASSATARNSTPVATLASPTYEAIADRAYQLYLQRGAQDGQDVEDWLRAEQELAREQAAPAARRPKLSKPEAA